MRLESVTAEDFNDRIGAGDFDAAEPVSLTDNTTRPYETGDSFNHLRSPKTLDQHIADHVGGDTPLRSIEVGTEDTWKSSTNDGEDRGGLSWSLAGVDGAIPVADVDQVIGKAAAVDLVQGQVLTDAMVTSSPVVGLV